MKRIPYALTVLAAFTLGFGIYCRSLGLHADFLRAESGLYLNMAFVDSDSRWAFVRGFLTGSYNGHYTPLAFLAELGFARLFGATEHLWFWRQMLVAGALGTALAFSGYRLSRASHLSVATSVVCAAALGTFFLCQPIMLEILSWPFMAMQLIALALTAASIASLASYVTSHRVSHFAWFIGLAYGSMHFFGVGLAISLAAIVTAGSLSIWLGVFGRRERAILVIATLATAGHAFMMLHNGTVPAQMGEPLSIAGNLSRFGMVLMDSIYAALRSMWASGGFVWPRMDVMGSEAVYGFGLMATFAMLLIGVLVKSRVERRTDLLVPASVTLYAFLCLLAYIAMVVARLRAVPSDDILLTYLIGPRYVIFPSAFLFMAGAAWVPFIVRRLGRVGTGVVVMASITAAVGTLVFAHASMPVIWPYTVVDSQQGWNAAVEKARAELAAGEPLSATSFAAQDPEFKITLRGMVPVLEHYLKCTGCAHFRP
jgi:hypothetical protein